MTNEKMVTMTLTAGVFTATCEGLSGSGVSRRAALHALCDAYGAQGRWLNLGEVPVVGPEPEVGMAATYCIGSDCYAYTVTAVHSANRIELTEDKTHGGLYVPGAGGRAVVASRRKGGLWRRVKQDHGSFILGERETRLDPSF